MQTYTSYKPSNIDWIGDIPSHWELKKIKFLKSKEKYSLVDGPFGSNLKTEHYIDNGDVYVIESGFITSGEFIKAREFKTITSEHFDTILRSECKEGDIIIAKIGENYGMSGILPKLNKKSVISGNSISLTVSNNSEIRFIHHVLLQHRYNGTFKKEVQQTGQPFIGLGVIDNLLIPTPTINEQQAIVIYLKNKTALIDELIQKKESKIELLKEQRSALINHVVTKGLNPDAAFKDSGIEWIGEIPEHWEAKLLKYAANKIDESPISKELLFAVENIESYTGKLIGLEKELEYEGSIAGFREGDIIFNKLRPYLSKVYYAECAGGYYGELLTIRGKKRMYPKYLYHILSSRGFLEIVNSSSEGTKMPRANWETSIKLISVSQPPIEEQKAIVSYLDEQTTVIDKSISLEIQKIEKLKEYRQSLISNVVTGKIKVV